jgi:hypothetical protein
MGAYGNPRYLCDECSGELDSAIASHEVSEIEAAMASLGDKMLKYSPDSQTFEAVENILSSAKDRCAKIADGSYDFALDEVELASDGEPILEDIPEELCESEEDKELDRQEEVKQKQLDKFFNYVNIGLGIGIVITFGYIIYKLFF